MAKCKGCGVELLDGTVFCPYCGTQVATNEEQEVQVVNELNQDGFNETVNVDYQAPKQESKAFKVFATLGQIFGIVALVFIGLTLLSAGVPESAWFVACMGLELAIPGFVFSIIGKKSKNYRGKATFGFIANLIGIIVLFLLAVVLLTIAMLEGEYDPNNGFYF